MRSVFQAWGREVSGASAAVFRIGFGLAGMLLVTRFFVMDWIDRLYVDPVYHFPYPGFEWVYPWPGVGMHIHFLVMGMAALGIVLGYRLRASGLVFALGLAYVELIDRALYLNHYYWMVLTAAILAFLPANSVWSLDARAGRARRAIPMGAIWLLRFQVGMVYFFSGLAKVNADWLIRGEPLDTWLPARAEMWLIGPLLTVSAAALVLSWAGAFFDLTIVAWLSIRRTRLAAFSVLVSFHALTWLLFPRIGVFPLLMSIGALIFFEPDWPQRWRATASRAPSAAGGVGSISRKLSPVLIGAVGLYVVLMVAIPLRHYSIPGDVKLTGEGYLGSWQVMLSEKSGSVYFVATDPSTGASWRVPPPTYLTPRQVEVMATDPVMIEQAAALVSRDLGGLPIGVEVWMAFNGRVSRPVTDPAEVLAGG